MLHQSASVRELEHHAATLSIRIATVAYRFGGRSARGAKVPRDNNKRYRNIQYRQL